ncbi:MAG: phosphatidylglycerophosphatase A [Kiritimatiellae bacterium]|nr:phosphatidylglycerophosphatase A [Kiritimatiellia bacterium]
MKKLLRKAATFAACGFGLGYSPVAPGTVGSLLGCLIVWGFTAAKLSVPAQIAACAAMTVFSVPLAGIAEREIGRKDPGSVVCDEYLTFPICMIGLLDKWQDRVWLMPACFVVARVLDIWKPQPARRLQALPGGLGITIDDFVTTCEALAADWALYLAAVRLGF